jgi:hypothetical protein
LEPACNAAVVPGKKTKPEIHDLRHLRRKSHGGVERIKNT